MRLRGGVLIALKRRVSVYEADGGVALISAILFMILVAGLSLVLLGVMIGQAGPSLVSQKSAQTGYAAQAGLQATLNTIRSIQHTTSTGEVYGDRSKLPCTLTGRVDGSSDALTYSVDVQYFSSDPTYMTDTQRASSHLTCVSGSGVTPQPQFAFIMSHGVGTDVVNQPAGTGNRGIAAVYSFKLSNINIPGGLLLTSANGYCVRASSVAVNATLSFISKANCTDATTDNWIYTPNIEFKLASSESTDNPNGLCITQGAPTGITYPLSLQQCMPIPDPNRWSQLWSIDGGTTLWGQKNPVSSGRSNVCLAFQNVVAGGVVQASTSNCDGWSPDYKVGSGAASHDTNEAVSFGQFGRCMDVTNGTISSSYMIVWPCKQDPTGTGTQLNWNHRFFYTEPAGLSESVATKIVVHVGNLANGTSPDPSDGNTYCMTTPVNTSSSSYPTFIHCDSNNARQNWTRTADSSAGYAQSWTLTDTYGRCITALTDDLFNSWIAKLGVQNCTGSSVQKWNAPPYVTEAVVGGYKELSG